MWSIYVWYTYYTQKGIILTYLHNKNRIRRFLYNLLLCNLISLSTWSYEKLVRLWSFAKKVWPGLFMSVCLDNFAYVPFENICSYQNVTIATEGLLFLDIDILTPICMAEQRQFFIVTWHRASGFVVSHSRLFTTTKRNRSTICP